MLITYDSGGGNLHRVPHHSGGPETCWGAGHIAAMVQKMAGRDRPVVSFSSHQSREGWKAGSLGIKSERILSFRSAFLTS